MAHTPNSHKVWKVAVGVIFFISNNSLDAMPVVETTISLSDRLFIIKLITSSLKDIYLVNF